MQPLLVSAAIMEESFAHFRRCGEGRRECQVLWVGPWSNPRTVDRVVHPGHVAYGDGFELDTAWLSSFWLDLARDRLGVHAQVHTHPRRAFHSPTDDQWPIIHASGFLSLVIPDFGMGVIGLEHAYLTEIQPDGTWQTVNPRSRLRVA